MIDVAEVISRFGGAAQLSLRFGAGGPSRKAIGMWAVRGEIPGRWALPLLRLAANEGVLLSEEELLSTTKRGNGS